MKCSQSRVSTCGMDLFSLISFFRFLTGYNVMYNVPWGLFFFIKLQRQMYTFSYIIMATGIVVFTFLTHLLGQKNK